MAFGRRPSTDIGTAALHILLLILFLVLLGTGLRIASDDPDALWLTVFDPILPMEHLWYWHLVSGAALAACLGAYVVYVTRAALTARIRFDSARLHAIWRGGRPRLAAINVAAVWLLLGSLLAEIVTGAMLFWGAGESILSLHLWATWLCLACIALHVAMHAAYGGVDQALRIFRPSRLRAGSAPPDLAELLAEQLRHRRSSDQPSPPMPDPSAIDGGANSLQSHPLASGLVIAALVAGAALGAEDLTRPVLPIRAIAHGDAPTIDGELSDPVWAKATTVSVMTTQGGDFGGSHQSRVEIRALHDDKFAYFAFVWEDPTRSLKHLPLVKDRDGWRIASTDENLVDESVYNEDKFAVLLSPGGLPLIGAAIHLASRPIAGRPPASSGRGLHYTLDGSILDVWQWRASHGGRTGYIDNCHIGAPGAGHAAQYTGGFGLDPGPKAYQPNFVGDPTPTSATRVHPRRLPKDPAAMREAMGRLTDATNESESEGARWWMTVSESVPYSSAADAAIPVGTVMPGVIVEEATKSGASDVRGFGRWAAGRWTLELMRRLQTGSSFDVDIKDGVLMWVAAFDHAEKRHTHHLRPVRLHLK
ncbi:MAG TPA: ethylbenzene dehydrogenase-related protein [Hyphomicrobiaceae bacterium]|nr:ethylbenzene dehydrogenase-related protein [Hyphomicrobiaceae bacterium]